MPTAWEEVIQQLKELNPKYRRPSVNAELLSIFTRQFSAMIDAGIPMPRALNFFAEGGTSPALETIMTSVADKVFSGVRLSHAMRSYPETFSDVYISMVETGESSGHIGTAMQRLAELMEKQVHMRKRIIATLTYPGILFCVSILCVFLFVFMILPMVEPMFTSMKLTLPLPTRIMLSSRRLLMPLLIIGVVVAVASWIFRPFIRIYLKKRPALRSRLARIPLTMPVFGNVIRKIAVSRILYSLATMLESGMGLVQAMARSASVAGNPWIAERLDIAKAAVIDGETVSHALELAQVFPPSAVQLITVGEETSSLSTMVKYVAQMYEEDADYALTEMANMLEPIMMAGMGIIVGFIVISAMLPTLQLIQSL